MGGGDTGWASRVSECMGSTGGGAGIPPHARHFSGFRVAPLMLWDISVLEDRAWGRRTAGRWTRPAHASLLLWLSQLSCAFTGACRRRLPLTATPLRVSRGGRGVGRREVSGDAPIPTRGGRQSPAVRRSAPVGDAHTAPRIPARSLRSLPPLPGRAPRRRCRRRGGAGAGGRQWCGGGGAGGAGTLGR